MQKGSFEDESAKSEKVSSKLKYAHLMQVYTMGRYEDAEGLFRRVISARGAEADRVTEAYNGLGAAVGVHIKDFSCLSLLAESHVGVCFALFEYLSAKKNQQFTIRCL